VTRTLPQIASELDTTWLVVSAVLVMFMQAGFACLEIGFSRGKNAGTVVAKILLNFSVASLVWWMVGFGLAFGGGAALVGESGFLLSIGDVISKGSPIPGPFDEADAGYVLFQLVFCCVSLAIVWGTTLERIRFVAYPIYAAVFAAVIYPLVAHWIFGGGWLDQFGAGMQDFAGSTVVHLTGATGGLAALLLLGARRGKYGPDGQPRAIPGHSMPIFGLGVLILWLGWFGFNGGSTIGTEGNRFAEVALITNLAAAAGVVGASIACAVLTRRLDIGMVGNGAIGALVAITAPCGFVELWAAPIIGLVAGGLVVVSVLAIDRVLDDPVGALSAHGVAGVWGTLSCGLFAAPRIVDAPGVPGGPGLFYGGGLDQLGVQAVGVLAAFTLVFVLSYLTFAAIKATVGLRVTETEEREGLDIVEHGMYGYPEQFMAGGELADGATALIGADAPSESAGSAAR
jgi:Amt family ammonium transporter